MISFQLDATPICGLGQSASVMPTARSMPRAAARSNPSVTSLAAGFISTMTGSLVRRMCAGLTQTLLGRRPRAARATTPPIAQ